MQTPGWVVVGYTREFCEQVVASFRRAMRDDPRELPLTAITTGIAARYEYLRDPTSLAVLRHLGFRTESDDLSDWEAHARACPAHAMNYFHGNWRDGFVEFGHRDDGEPDYPPDPSRPWIKRGPLTVAECRRQLDWLDFLRIGLLWSLMFGVDDAVRALAEWPADDLPEDEGLDDLTYGDRCYYLLLCRYLSGKEVDWNDRLVRNITASRSKRPRLLLECLRAISERNQTAYARLLVDILRQYQKAGFHNRAICRCISMEGTVINLVARSRGMQTPTISPPLAHLLMTPESLKLRR